MLRWSAGLRGQLSYPVSDGIRALFAGADPNSLIDRHHKNLAIPDFVCTRSVLNRLHSSLDKRIIEYDFDLELREEVDHVLGPAIDLGVPLLPPESFHLGDGHAGDADFVQRILYLVEFEGFDDRFDFFHGFTISH
jgi:hypothetical protein